MNFKPSLLKTIVSLFVGLIVFIYFAGSIMCDSPDGCTQHTIYSLEYGVIILIVVYLIWSLFQKDKIKKIKGKK